MESLVNDALTGKSCVSVDQNAHHLGTRKLTGPYTNAVISVKQRALLPSYTPCDPFLSLSKALAKRSLRRIRTKPRYRLYRGLVRMRRRLGQTVLPTRAKLQHQNLRRRVAKCSAAHLVRVGSSWLEFNQGQIFTQVDSFPPFGRLSHYSSQLFNLDGVGYRLATHLARVGTIRSSWLEFDQGHIFAQLEPSFPPFGHLGQLESSCFVIVRWLRGRSQIVEWFSCELVPLGSTVWPPINARFDFITWLELGVPFGQGLTLLRL